MKLHVAPPSPRAFTVLAVARHLGLDFELCPVDILNGAHLRPEFAALNPNSDTSARPRGSDVRFAARWWFPQQFAPPAHVVTLEQNYRSTVTGRRCVRCCRG